MALTLQGPARVEGELAPPGDKSISHRAAILAALAPGTSRISGYLWAEDTRATLGCLRSLGVTLREEGGAVLVEGGRLRPPPGPLDCLRSGTTLRLLAGVLAGQPWEVVLTGHPQLLGRPMERIAEPLGQMGAGVETTSGRAPLTIRGGALRGRRFRLPLASAQVKSCLLLAGLHARGATEVLSPAPSRDHTERLLEWMGARLQWDSRRCRLEPDGRLRPIELSVVGDASSAAPFLAAAAMLPGSRVQLRRVGTNPTRTGFLQALQRMGLSVEILRRGEEAREPWADLVAQAPDQLQALQVTAEEVPLLIDELPLLAVVATQAQGESRVSGAAELRVKETDRIAGIVGPLRQLGARVEETPDGFAVEGPTPLYGRPVSAGGDHRLAMALAVAGLAARGETVIQGLHWVADSYPGFVSDLLALARAPQGGRR